MRDVIRRVKFAPYRKGMGPSFTLTLWDTGRIGAGDIGSRGKHVLGYELKMHERARSNPNRVKTAILFSGEDYYCAPGHAIDSDQSVESIMSFLTLRPGDTDSEYFEAYTPEQLDYCSNYAESLSCEVMNRFGEDN